MSHYEKIKNKIVNTDGDQGLFNWADCVGNTQFVPSFTIINSSGNNEQQAFWEWQSYQ